MEDTTISQYAPRYWKYRLLFNGSIFCAFCEHQT